MFPPSGGSFAAYVKRTAITYWNSSPLFSFDMVFPYLSTTPPEKAGILSGVRQLTDSMGRSTPPWFSPSRPGCPGTEVSSYCDVSRLYAGSCPALTGRLPLGSLGSSWRSPLMWLLVTGLYLKNVYSVVKEHLVRRPRNNLVVTSKILSEMLMFAVGQN